jgi:hypothetical protein
MREEKVLERPIIILGAARSGTTLLGDIVGKHPSVAYWVEPKHVWRHGHAYRSHDVLSAADATPRLTRYIRRQFGSFVSRAGKERFAEKTPSNCFRLPFIRRVLPDAQVVHLLRDGRAAVASAMQQWRNDVRIQWDAAEKSNTSYGTDAGDRGAWTGLGEGMAATKKFLRQKHRLAGGFATILDAPAYIPDLLRVFARKVTAPDRSFLWGPRFPGLRQVHRELGVLPACALQWMLSVQYAMAGTDDLPDAQIRVVRFEELMENPKETIADLLAFLRLDRSDKVLREAVQTVRPEDPERWRRAMTEEEALLLEAWVHPVNQLLGYTSGRHWKAAAP